MHFEVLVEDESGRVAVDIVLEKIFGANRSLHSWRTHGYKSLGNMPKDLRDGADEEASSEPVADPVARVRQEFGDGVQVQNCKTKKFSTY